MKKWIPWLVVAGLGIGIFVTYTLMLQAQYDRGLAEANQRALTAEVQEWQSKAGLADTLRTVARSLFQLQQEIDSDSIANLATALGTAVREQELTVRALQRVEIEMERVSQSNLSLVDMLRVFNPEGRPEDLHVTQVEGPPIEGEIVVAVPADDALPAEWEIQLEVSPWELTYVLGCTETGDATAVFETPPWVTATPEQGTVDPEICQGPRPTLGSGIQFSLGNVFLWGGLGLASGFVLGLLAG